MLNTSHVTLTRQGGPEVMQWSPVSLASPARGQALIRHEAIGVNFIDVYQRDGTYSLELPSGLGHEAAGTVVAVGEGVSELKPGDRVVDPSAGLGAYALSRLVPADRLVVLPIAYRAMRRPR